MTRCPGSGCGEPEPPLPLTLRNVPPPPELRPALLREVPAQAGAGELQHPLRGHGLHGLRRGRTDGATDGAAHGAAAAVAIHRSRRVLGRRRHLQTARLRLPAPSSAAPQPIRAIVPPRPALHPISKAVPPGPALLAELQPISAAAPHGPGRRRRALVLIRKGRLVAESAGGKLS